MLPIRLSSILVTFSDDRYSVLLHQQGEDVGEGGGGGGGCVRNCVHKVAMETLELRVGGPSFFSFEVPATKGSSALSVSEVTLHWGGGAGGDGSIRIPANSRHTGDTLPAALGGSSTHGGIVGAVGGGRWDVVSVAEDEPDAVLMVSCAGPALVGEKQRVVISVKAKAGKTLKAARLSLLATPDQQVVRHVVCVDLFYYYYLFILTTRGVRCVSRSWVRKGRCGSAWTKIPP